MKYIGIEGSSYVGKTTVAEKLKNDGYETMEEYDLTKIYKHSDNTLKDKKEIIDILLSEEMKRTPKIKQSNNSSLIFSDRTPISFISFEDMKIHESKNEEERLKSFLAKEYLMSQLHEKIKSNKIILPNLIIVLFISNPEIFYERVRQRGITKVSELSKFNTQLLIARSAIKNSNLFLGENNTRIIDIKNMKSNEIIDIIKK